MNSEDLILKLKEDYDTNMTKHICDLVDLFDEGLKDWVKSIFSVCDDIKLIELEYYTDYVDELYIPITLNIYHTENISNRRESYLNDIELEHKVYLIDIYDENLDKQLDKDTLRLYQAFNIFLDKFKELFILCKKDRDNIIFVR